MSVFIRAIVIIYLFFDMAHSTGLSLSPRYHHAALRSGPEATIYSRSPTIQSFWPSPSLGLARNALFLPGLLLDFLPLILSLRLHVPFPFPSPFYFPRVPFLLVRNPPLSCRMYLSTFAGLKSMGPIIAVRPGLFLQSSPDRGLIGFGFD
ncbi:hypothetical protein H4582DRAFT_1600447 [Lactarius indigo]|nr:hypothetical protein H4582DRAFT_1600447 [Lactarius indigo]